MVTLQNIPKTKHTKTKISEKNPKMYYDKISHFNITSTFIMGAAIINNNHVKLELQQ